jgi:hypothetical protein
VADARALRVVGSVPADQVERLAAAGRLASLEDLVRVGFDVVDVIVQDEYTHDVIARGREPAFLCFDTT